MFIWCFYSKLRFPGFKCGSSFRSSFSTDHQFQHLVRFITDQTQTPNVRVKEAILNYLTALVQTNMQPSDLKNSSSSRLGLTKIINWTMDGRTPEIRKNSQRVLLALKELNPEEFQLIIDTLDEYSHVSSDFLLCEGRSMCSQNYEHCFQLFRRLQ